MISTYEDFKDLTRRTASDKVLHNEAFDVAKNPKYDGYQRELASLVYKLLDKKSSNQRLAQELHKPIRNFEKRKKLCSFKDNIQDADLAHMQLINKFDKAIHFLLCFIGIVTK